MLAYRYFDIKYPRLSELFGIFLYRYPYCKTISSRHKENKQRLVYWVSEGNNINVQSYELEPRQRGYVPLSCALQHMDTGNDPHVSAMFSKFKKLAK
jgi:hypothetical protein